MKAYKIETERLVIRCYQPSDAIKLKNVITNSLNHLLPWMPWAKNEPEDLETKINRLREFRGNFDLGKDYTFGIFNKENNDLVGSTGLHPRVGNNAMEIGYWISAKYINQGLALEAVSALTKVGFEIENLSRIEIHCAPDNIRSQNIPKKLGYELEATLKNRGVDSKGNPRDSMIWTMFKSRYEVSPLKHINLRIIDIIDRDIVI